MAEQTFSVSVNAPGFSLDNITLDDQGRVIITSPEIARQVQAMKAADPMVANPMVAKEGGGNGFCPTINFSAGCGTK